MENRIILNSSNNSYLMDIANKLILPTPVLSNCVLDKDDVEYNKQRDKLLQSINPGNYEEFIDRRLSRRITPFMVKHQLANMTQLVFEVTEACNLKCKYCAYGEFYGDYDDLTQKVAKLAPQLRDLKKIKKEDNSVVLIVKLKN